MSSPPASSNRQPDIPMRGWKVTISTKFDVSDTTIDKFTKYCRKTTEMHHIVLEHGSSGTKHLHALLCFEQPKIKRVLQDYFWKNHVKDFNEGNNIQKFAVRVDVLYDNKWISEYLSKEENYIVNSSNYDADRERDFYATPENKSQLETATAVASLRSCVFAKHKEYYLKWYAERHNNIQPDAHRFDDVHEYICWRMRINLDLQVIQDPRRINQLVIALTYYINGVVRPDFEDRKQYASRDHNVLDFSG